MIFDQTIKMHMDFVKDGTPEAGGYVVNQG